VTLEQKIGQMVLAGFRGLSVDTHSPVIKDIRSGRLGGVILFDKDVSLDYGVRNIKSPKQVKELNRALQDYAEGNLIISIDQEGGLIARLKEENGFVSGVSHKQIGDRDDINYTGKRVGAMAEMLAEAGFNMNFAPVVDLNLNKQNPVIGSLERSFSDNVDIVVKHADIYIDEMAKEGIVSVLKHFPGHGSSTSDSHKGFVDVTNLWNSSELMPFAKLIDLGKADVIMTAHIFNSHYDKKYPATLSSIWLTDVLRGKLNFNGVIVTDDMQMKAISRHYTLVESIELTINAGTDILMFANNVAFEEDIAVKVNDIILELVKTNRISEERIENSYQRIKNLKSRIFK